MTTRMTAPRLGRLIADGDVEAVRAAVQDSPRLLSAFEATAAVYKWLPGGALEAMTTTFRGGPAAVAPDLLDRWQGGLLLLGYGLVAALLGTLLAVRRDVV